MFGFKPVRKLFILGVAILLQMVGIKTLSAKEKETALIVLGVWSSKRSDSHLTTEVTRRLRELGEDAQPPHGAEKADWNCAGVTCLRAVAERQHAARILQVVIEEVDRDSQNYLVDVRVYDRTTGRIEQHQANCDGCGAEQRVGYIAATAAKLVERLDAAAAELGQQGTSRPGGDFGENGQQASSASTSQAGSAAATISILPQPGREQAPLSMGRKKAGMFLAGIAISSGALSIALSGAALANKAFCSSDWNDTDAQGRPANDRLSNCLPVTLGTSWGITAIASTIALAVTYAKPRK